MNYTDEEDEIQNMNFSILKEDNYDNHINKIKNNYSDLLSNLKDIIDENFTIVDCGENIDSESIILSDFEMIDSSTIKNCSKYRYSTNLNYSEYNFNVVKFRTGISNSRKFPETFNSIFDDLNYNNIIDSEKIIEIDDILNNKNVLFISNTTKYKTKEIKKEFISMIQETFEDFGNNFLTKGACLTCNYWEILNEIKNVLNYNDINYNNNISQIFDYIKKNIKKILNNFNSSLYDTVNTFPNLNDYEFYSINYLPIYNQYFSMIEDSFNEYILKIENLKSNNLFYSIPKFILNEIYLERRKQIGEKLNKFSEKFNFNSFGFKYDIASDFDLYLKKYYTHYELNNSYDYFNFMENNSDIYINKLLKEIINIKNTTESKFSLIFENFIDYIKQRSNYVENEFIHNLKTNNSKCLNTSIELKENISDYLNITNLTE